MVKQDEITGINIINMPMNSTHHGRNFTQYKLWSQTVIKSLPLTNILAVLYY